MRPLNLEKHLKSVQIHPTAIVESGAELGIGVEVGPYALIGKKVKLGDHVKVDAFAKVTGSTTVGASSHVYSYACLGTEPQHTRYKGEDTELICGEHNMFREYSNFSLGTVVDQGKTIIGSHNFFMANVHIAHDCIIGNNCTFTNFASMGGHVQVGDRVNVSGFVGVHQFTRIGSYAMLAGGAMVGQDIAPFVIAGGDHAVPLGINIVGLKRAGFKSSELKDIKTMYRLLFRSTLSLPEILELIQTTVPDSSFKEMMLNFIKSSKRGLARKSMIVEESDESIE